MAKNARIRVGADPYLAISKKKVFGLILLTLIGNLLFYGAVATVIHLIIQQFLKGA